MRLSPLILLLPVGLLYQPWIIDEQIQTSGRIINDMGKLEYLEKNCPSTSSTTYPT